MIESIFRSFTFDRGVKLFILSRAFVDAVILVILCFGVCYFCLGIRVHGKIICYDGFFPSHGR